MGQNETKTTLALSVALSLAGLLIGTAAVAKTVQIEDDYEMLFQAGETTRLSGFPGLYGYGRGTTGAMGTTHICKVTSTADPVWDDPSDDSNLQPGTLRYCLRTAHENESDGGTLVIIETGGQIWGNPQPIYVQADNVTIWGAYAATTWCLSGSSFTFTGDNHLVRHICAEGTDIFRPRDRAHIWNLIDRPVAFQRGERRVLSDSVIRLGNDGNLSISTYSQWQNRNCNWTVQNSLLGPALANSHDKTGPSLPSMGKLAEFGSGDTENCQGSFIGNGLFSGHRRGPRSSGMVDLEVSGNVNTGFFGYCFQSRENSNTIPGAPPRYSRNHLWRWNICQMTPGANTDRALEIVYRYGDGTPGNTAAGDRGDGSSYFRQNYLRDGGYSEITNATKYENEVFPISRYSAATPPEFPAWARTPALPFVNGAGSVNTSELESYWMAKWATVGRRFPARDEFSEAELSRITANNYIGQRVDCIDAARPEPEANYRFTCSASRQSALRRHAAYDRPSVLPAALFNSAGRFDDEDNDGCAAQDEREWGSDPAVADCHLPLAAFNDPVSGRPHSVADQPGLADVWPLRQVLYSMHVGDPIQIAEDDGQNRAPTALALSNDSVDENAANGTAVGQVSVTDPDAGDTASYTLTDTAGGRFAIDSETGQITVANGTLLDFEAATSHDVTVQATDSGGLSVTETFTITVEDVTEEGLYPLTIERDLRLTITCDSADDCEAEVTDRPSDGSAVPVVTITVTVQ